MGIIGPSGLPAAPTLLAVRVSAHLTRLLRIEGEDDVDVVTQLSEPSVGHSRK